MGNLKVNGNLQAHYDDHYSGSETEWRSLITSDRVANIEYLCHSLPHSTILDIGAGEGSILKRLSESRFGDNFYALEISSSGLRKIKEKEIPRLIDCSLFDGYNIPYSDNRFDLAVLSHVIEHVEYPRKLIYEAARVAKVVFVEVPLEDTFRQNSDFSFNKNGHINFYSSNTIRKLIQTCNLVVLNQIFTHHSKMNYIHLSGKKGLINYFIKEYFLKLSAYAALKIFTYHSSLICQVKEK